MHLSLAGTQFWPSIRLANGIFHKVLFVFSASSKVFNTDECVSATQTVLSKIPPNDSKLTYAADQYLFHYISEGGFTYLVMADDSAGR
jgi:hypothetical protein